MIPGTAYIGYKIGSWLGQAFAKANGATTKEEQEKFGAFCGMYLGCAVGAGTGDVLGIPLMINSTANKLNKPSP